jgi:hypothetical protein
VIILPDGDIVAKEKVPPDPDKATAKAIELLCKLSREREQQSKLRATEGMRIIPLIKIIGGLACGAYLLYSGTQMIYRDINTAGIMTLKFFGNELSATSIGIVVIFIGAVIIITTIRWRLTEEHSTGDKARYYDGGY